MGGYILRRCIAGVVVLLMLTFLTFMMINAAPGSTLIALLSEGPGGGAPTPEQLEAFERELGLDKPVLERYVSWLGNVVTGDMGRSIVTRQSVWKEIQDRLPVSLELMLLSMTIAIVFAIPIGVYSAVRQGGPTDYGARIFAVLGLAVPTFWLGVLVLVFFTEWTGISLATLNPPYIWNGVLDNLQGFIAPALVLGFTLMATTMRMTRSTVLDVMHEDYVRTARAKGLRERQVVTRHVLRNALIPVITIIGTQAAFLIGGSVVVETIFRIDGIGNLAFTAVGRRDFTLIMGVTIFLGTVVVIMNLLIDLSYSFLDPRIRYGGRS